MKSIEWQVMNGAVNSPLSSVDDKAIFKLIFENSDLGIALTDSIGTVLLANAQLAKIELQAHNKFNFSALLKDKTESNASTIFQNQGWGPFKVTRLPHNQNGTLVYVWIVTPDFEIETNHKLGILLNLYRSFIDTTFEMVFRTNREGKIVFANQLFIKHFGFSNYKKAKETDFKSLFEEEERFGGLLLKLDTDKKISDEMVFLRKADNTKFTGMLNGSLHTDNQGNELINWAMLNISEQVNFENKLKTQNEELAKVNHQMEKFLYSTSHDLRSPLTSILGLVNLMRMEKNEPYMVDYINKIETTTLKLDKIIEDIMSFSRSTYQRTTSEKIDFETLAWKSINQYQADPIARKINFDVKKNGGFPFFGDTERIEIIIENIIRNSIHFFDANKSRPFIKVNITLKKEGAHLEFIDNGIGIGKQHLSQVFNMFYKASHLSKGAGLGLFIVKETLEKINGTIQIESEIGFGTVVRINIPNDHKGILISRKMELQNQGG